MLPPETCELALLDLGYDTTAVEARLAALKNKDVTRRCVRDRDIYRERKKEREERAVREGERESVSE